MSNKAPFEGMPTLPSREARREAAARALEAPVDDGSLLSLRNKTAKMVHNRRMKQPEKVWEIKDISVPHRLSLHQLAANATHDLKYVIAVDVRRETHQPAVKMLRKQLGVNRRDSSGSYPLHSAAANGNLGACKSLCDTGAEVAATDVYGSTALHVAAANGRSGVAVFLLRRGAQLGAQTAGGKTPLHYANERVPFSALASAAEMVMLLTAAAQAQAEQLSPRAVATVAEAAGRAAKMAVERWRDPQDPLAATGGKVPAPVVAVSKRAGEAAVNAIKGDFGLHEASAAATATALYLLHDLDAVSGAERAGKAAARHVNRLGATAALDWPDDDGRARPAAVRAAEGARRAAAAALAHLPQPHTKAEMAEAAKAAARYAALHGDTPEDRKKAAHAGAEAAAAMARAQEELRLLVCGLDRRRRIEAARKELKARGGPPRVRQPEGASARVEAAPREEARRLSREAEVASRQELSALQQQLQGVQRSEAEARAREAQHARAAGELQQQLQREHGRVGELEAQVTHLRAEMEKMREQHKADKAALSAQRGVEDDNDPYGFGDD